MNRDALGFLARAAREVRPGDWVFTGFHWPVVAAYTGRLLGRSPFTQVVEAGAALTANPAVMPSSTTDFAVLDPTVSYRAGTAETLQMLSHRYDLTMLDAGTLDLMGRINSTAIGPLEEPKTRLAGGGGAADAAAGAKRLLLLHGAADPKRIEREVEHVTSAPGPHAEVLLITRFGVVRLGQAAALLEVTESAGGEGLAARLEQFGVATADARVMTPPDAEESNAAGAALQAAAGAGYRAAAQFLAE